MFQSTVNRNFTQGFVGDIMNDGPFRAKPARIAAPAVALNPNRIGRAFGYSSEVTPGTPAGGITGVDSTTQAFIEANVQVGGAVFYGILGIPKRYALFGNTTDGPLGASYDLPTGTLGEFVDMGILVASVANGSDTTGNATYGAQVYFCNAAGVAAAGFVATSTTDVGRLYVFPAGGTIPARFTAIPNAIITDPVTAVPSATPNPTDGSAITDANNFSTRVQLTR